MEEQIDAMIYMMSMGANIKHIDPDQRPLLDTGATHSLVNSIHQ